MKIPNVNCKIEMLGSVNPSEDTDKIKTASQIFFLNQQLKLKIFLLC